MKKLLLITLLTSVLNLSYAQKGSSTRFLDLIVMDNGDSVRCAIVSEQDGMYRIQTAGNSEQTITRTVNRDNVIDANKSYYANIGKGTEKKIRLVYPEYPDLIVLNNGDSIRCKVTTRTYNSYVVQAQSDGKRSQNETILISQIKSYNRRYFDTPEKIAIENSEKGESGIRFSIGAGYSILMGSLNEMHEYYVPPAIRLRSSYNITTQLQGILPNRKVAVGATFNFRGNSYDFSDFDFDNPLTQLSAEGKVKTNIIFVGPVVTVNYGNYDRTNYWFSDISIGYAHASQKTDGLILQNRKVDELRLNRSGFGSIISIGNKSTIGRNLGFEVRLWMLAGSIGKSEEWEGRNISSINLSLGFSFGK